jgi:hypothetical protein
VVAAQYQEALTILFIIFATILVLAVLIAGCVLSEQVKKSFWNSFYILKLMPTEDVDKDFVKRVNDYLSKA